ncbi:MAG TPA: ricin-type beta-trefoil lectin domain protein [Catenuloplanes sp.]
MTGTATRPELHPGGPRRPRWSGDSGSMPLAMLLTVVGVTLTSALLSMVVSQTTGTATATSRAVEVHAAQAGLDAGVAHIRAAFTDDARNEYNDRVGNLGKLPCGALPVSSAGGGRYQVRMDYLDADPATRKSGTLEKFIQDHRINCTYGLVSTPAVALLRSTGTMRQTGPVDAGPHRTLRGTYAFRISNQNVLGGQIRVYEYDELCLDAGSDVPLAGDNLRMANCNPALPQQKFAYNTDLTISLVSSRSKARPLGMCVDAGTLPYSAAEGNATFQPCVSPAVPRQRWSFSDQASMMGTTADNQAIADFCLRLPTPVASTVVRVGTETCNTDYNPVTTFTPDPAVGAGAAGPKSGQLVNYFEFGRCADVTRRNINREFMQAWPCKQAPDQSKLLWNQLWTVPEPVGDVTEASGPVTVIHPGTTVCGVDENCGERYCLQVPSPPAKGSYPVMVNCQSVTPPNTTWIRTVNTGDYATSYQISDNNPDPDKRMCLSVIDPTDPKPDYRTDEDFPNISKLVMARCDGSTLQKWNAPPNITQGQPLKDVAEM